MKLAAALTLGIAAPLPALGQTCTAASTSLSFGTYNPLAAGAGAITATVSVTCIAGAVSVPVAYSIQLGAGSAGSVAARSMAAGAVRLNYQVYTTAARSVVWGDGTGGTSTLGDSYALPALGIVTKTYTAYGGIPAGQRVSPGVYLDVLTVLVVY